MTSDATPAKTLRVPDGFWAVVALVAWSLAVTAVIERGPYGLDEATARAVLFLWSISDQIASPIVTLGVPDFRAAYLIPAGALFSGSLLAIKLCTLVLVIATAIGLFRWRRSASSDESPLLATGLFLLAPLTIHAIDHVATGPFLLLSFLLAALADRAYRDGRIRFSGSFFAQPVLIIAAVSLHPAGLALPLVLALSWVRDPAPEPTLAAIIPGKERLHMLLAIGVATVLGVLLAAGWPQLAWFGNPLTRLAADLFDWQPQSGVGDVMLWVVGAILALGALAVMLRQSARWRSDLLVACVSVAALIGALTADACFACLVLALLLFWGFSAVLGMRLGVAGGFVAQRGLGLAALVLLSTLFLYADKSQYALVRSGGELSAQDQLLRTLSDSVLQAHPATPVPGTPMPEDGKLEKPRGGLLVASQWPGRTMIACRCNALPLPPANEDQALFLANLRGTEFVVFDPLSPVNRALSRNFALLGGAGAETVSLQQGGVVLRLHPEAATAAEPLPGPGPGVRG